MQFWKNTKTPHSNKSLHFIFLHAVAFGALILEISFQFHFIFLIQISKWKMASLENGKNQNLFLDFDAIEVTLQIAMESWNIEAPPGFNRMKIKSTLNKTCHLILFLSFNSRDTMVLVQWHHLSFVLMQD